MFAVVNIKGQQFKVEQGQEVFVHNLGVNQGDKVKFDEVLLVSNGDKTTVGTPTVKGASVAATVVDELVKGDKVIIFKKKRRKGYQLKRGHRQQFSKILIDSIKG